MAYMLLVKYNIISILARRLVMTQFVPYASGVEVNGQTVLSVVDGLGAHKRRGLEILSENGIQNPVPGKWYPQQAWLNAFKSISENLGPSTLYSIGFIIPENADFPPEIKTLGDALKSLDVAYHLNHRGGEIGHYTPNRIANREVHVVCDNPYPCDFDRGVVASLANRFKPYGHEHNARVQHADDKPCRKEGYDTCTYIVKW
jgi:hypothetical protein